MTRELVLLDRIVSLARDRRVRLEDFERAVADSPQLAVDVVRIADSPLYGMEGRIHGLQRAVLILGVETVAEIAASALANRCFRASALEPAVAAQRWAHSLQIGVCSRLIARRLGLRLETEGYVAGLVHELGDLDLQREPAIALLVQAAHAVVEDSEKSPDALLDLGLRPDDVEQLRAALDRRVEQLAAVI
jgi:HD-like signal output (HDOD) protein